MTFKPHVPRVTPSVQLSIPLLLQLSQAQCGCFPVPLRFKSLPTSVLLLPPQPDVCIKPPWLPSAPLCTFKMACFPQNTLSAGKLLYFLTMQAKVVVIFNTVQCTPAQLYTVPSSVFLYCLPPCPNPSIPLPTLLVYCLPAVSESPGETQICP